jgi:hypothetical protein
MFYEKETSGDSNTCEETCENEGKVWGDVSTSHRTPQIASKPAEVRGEA